MFNKSYLRAMKVLDPVDTKILKSLLQDGRKSFTEIGRELKVSKDSVCGRYKELVKSGVIVGATIQVNPHRFGYHAVVMIMLNVDSQNLRDVWEHVNKIPNTTFFRYYNSIYNIGAVFRLKDLYELENFKQMMNKQNQVNQFQTYIWTAVRNIPENILQGTEVSQGNSSPQEYQKGPFQIDEIDGKIMGLLVANGRLPFRKIADQTGAATSTVARRYRELRRNNVINSCIQINPHKLGYQNILEISLAVANQDEITEMANKISRIPGVTYLVQISGHYDLSVVSLVRDCKDIVYINERILEIPNIKRMEGTLRRLPQAWPGRSQHISTF